MPRSTWLLALALLASAPAVADEKPPQGAPPMVKPGAEIDSIKWLVGNATCDGKAAEMPGAAAHDFKAKATARLELGGFFVTYHYEETKAKNHPAFMAQGWWGWDAGLKRYVFGGADSTGGSFLFPGDKTGDTMEFKGEATNPMGMRGPLAFTWTKTAKGYSFKVMAGGPDGKMMDLASVDCTTHK
jgi:hypothetical protein